MRERCQVVGGWAMFGAAQIKLEDVARFKQGRLDRSWGGGCNEKRQRERVGLISPRSLQSMRDGKLDGIPPTMLFVDGEQVLRLAGKVQFWGRQNREGTGELEREERAGPKRVPRAGGGRRLRCGKRIGRSTRLGDSRLSSSEAEAEL
jgi:hypothetical protein